MAQVTRTDGGGVENMTEATAKFTANVYKELLKSNTDNFLVCPLSAEVVLALCQLGASGQTAQQIATALHLPESSSKVQEIFKSLLSMFEDNKKYTLSAANKIYVKDGLAIRDQFKNIAADVFNAEIQNMDFIKKEEAACEINQWVEKKTNEKIKNLTSQDDFGQDTLSVMVNALYFKGKWKHQFDRRCTRKVSFHINNNKSVEIDMMQRDTNFNCCYSKELNAKFLEMSYEGDDVTMTIVLPNEIEGLSTLEARIADVVLTPKYVKSRLEVTIPKFKMETSIEFKPILQALGIKDAFENNADFSGILDNQTMKISKVIQKTFIEVNEEGTEAAAASAGFCAYCSMPPTFKVDHPFMYYIKYKDVVVFIGRYVTPEA